MVVSYISALRSKADVALAMTKGARLMLSLPPATIRSDSPPRIARAAMATASRPEPHSRFEVTPPVMPQLSPCQQHLDHSHAEILLSRCTRRRSVLLPIVELQPVALPATASIH